MLRISEKMLNNMKTKLKNMAEGTDSDHFKWQLEQGRKFTYEELKMLTNQQKQDWV